jgi:hypothetical protein
MAANSNFLAWIRKLESGREGYMDRVRSAFSLLALPER